MAANRGRVQELKVEAFNQANQQSWSEQIEQKTVQQAGLEADIKGLNTEEFKHNELRLGQLQTQRACGYRLPQTPRE